MKAFMTPLQKDGKRRLVLVVTPETIEALRDGKPQVVDMGQSKLPLPLVVLIGYTPDERKLQTELERMGMRNNVIDAESLVLALEKCKETPGEVQ